MKRERGSILIITLTTVLFMLAFLISTYTIIANRRQAQAELRKEAKEIYEQGIENIDEMYAEYFADENAEIPIYNEEQLFQIATGNYILSENKIYHCLGEKQYKLMQDIEFYVEDTITDYPDSFNETTSKWIDIEDMIREGKLTGEFNYNGNVIKETDLDGNLIIHKVRPSADILGEGTEENPYVIYSIEALIKFADNVTKGERYSDQYVILGNDLDFEDEYSYNDPQRTDFGVYGYNGVLFEVINEGIGFIPIGESEEKFTGKAFCGVFDGKGKKIKNLKLKQNHQMLGLFSENKGTIQNLEIENAEINENTNGIRGILCAYQETGNINKCSVSGNIIAENIATGDTTFGGIIGQNVEAGVVKNSYNKAIISTSTATNTTLTLIVGGIAGNNTGIIQNCYNLGNLVGTQKGNQTFIIGGIVGYSTTDIINCYNLGIVKGIKEESDPHVGGIVGYSEKGIKNCCNSGNVLYVGNSNKHVGTLVGAIGGTLTNSYSLKTDGLNGIGQNYSGTTEPTIVNTIIEMPTVLEIVGSEFKEDTMYINDGYPILKY